jgi:Transposase DDE domain
VGKKTGPNPTDRGKSGVKRSLLVEGHGVAIGVAVEGANRHDMKLVRATVESLVVERPAPTEDHPQGMCLDKGYDDDEVYAILQEFGFTAHVRPRGEEAKAIKREAGGLRASVGGGTGTFVDEPLSPSADPLGQEARELPGVSAFRLWLDCVSRRRVIRIGF